jgi:hypothetical protein
MQEAARHCLRTDPNTKLHFTADKQGRVFVLITDIGYPTESAFALIAELEAFVLASVGSEILTAREGGLDSQCRPYLRKLVSTGHNDEL